MGLNGCTDTLLAHDLRAPQHVFESKLIQMARQIQRANASISHKSWLSLSRLGSAYLSATTPLAHPTPQLYHSHTTVMEEPVPDVSSFSWDDMTSQVQEVLARPPGYLAGHISLDTDMATALARLHVIYTTNEASERAFALAHWCIQEVPALYTAWIVYRAAQTETGKHLLQDLQKISFEYMEDPCKCYQVWYVGRFLQALTQLQRPCLLAPSTPTHPPPTTNHRGHRRALAQQLGPTALTTELSFVDLQLDLDAKNHHAWLHRQWLLRTFDQWQREDAAIERMLEEDPRNNSAWAHAMFVATRGSSEAATLSADDRLQLWALAVPRVSRLVGNEAAWSFLRRVALIPVTPSQYGPGWPQYAPAPGVPLDEWISTAAQLVKSRTDDVDARGRLAVPEDDAASASSDASDVLYMGAAYSPAQAFLVHALVATGRVDPALTILQHMAGVSDASHAQLWQHGLDVLSRPGPSS